MADYMAQMHGTYGNGDSWSTGLRITSNQTESGLLTTFSAAWTAAWTDGVHGLQPLYHTDTATSFYSVATLSGNMHEVTKSVLPSITAGTAADTPLPNDTAFLVSLRSPFVQKWGRGRAFLPAPVEGVLVSNEFTLASATRVKAAFLAVLTAIRADGSTIFVTSLHPPKNGGGQFLKTVITSHIVARKPASQRRRSDPDLPNYV
jgi:hypothetical protein